MKLQVLYIDNPSKMNNEEYLSDSSNEDPLNLFTIEDYINNPETHAILEDEFFNKFDRNMNDVINDFYKFKVSDTVDNFIDVFDKDYFAKNSSDLFFIIYSHVVKDYDISIFNDNPDLAKSMFKDEDNVSNKKKKSTKKIISKKFDWGSKTYK
tara:strand:+ start:203 stop:661 length:459 start_codon:yes stop_codon:yes gene_type:complete